MLSKEGAWQTATPCSWQSEPRSLPQILDLHTSALPSLTWKTSLTLQLFRGAGTLNAGVQGGPKHPARTHQLTKSPLPHRHLLRSGTAPETEWGPSGHSPGMYCKWKDYQSIK